MKHPTTQQVERAIEEFRDWYEQRNHVTTHYDVMEWLRTTLQNIAHTTARDVLERVDRIVRETMDGMELETNAEFIACDDFAIKIIAHLTELRKEFTPKDTEDKEDSV